MNMQELTLADVLWTLEVEQCDTPIRGNAMASGDDDADRAAEDEILKKLDDGNVWAWAMVRIQGTFMGLSAHTYIGGCSYDSEESFRADGTYEDIQNEVLCDLNGQLEMLGKAYLERTEIGTVIATVRDATSRIEALLA